MKKIELSDHFTCGKLLLYSLPGIGQVLAITSFQMVDGFFVSTYLGVVPFSAVDIISPAFFLLYGIGLMFGSGTGALVSKIMGEGNQLRAKQVFTMSVTVMALIGTLLGFLATVFLPTLAVWAGASPDNLPYCVAYGRLLTAFLPAYLINSCFMELWITAEKGWIGTLIAVMNGGLNVLFDWWFMGPLGWGIQGAGLATSLAAVVSAVFTLVYFFRKNSSSLCFVRFQLNQLRELFQICFNGASEMVDSISGNITQLVMNIQLMRLFGEVDVAAMGVYTYVIEFFLVFFFGISSTAITIVGYKYGEKNKKEINSLASNGILLMLVFGILMSVLFYFLAGPVAQLYVGYDETAFALTTKVLRIASLTCLLYGFVIFTSSLFTGLNDGLTSAVIAGCNSLAAPVVMIYLLPALFGADAIWYAIPAATFIAAILCAVLRRTQYPKLLKNLE